MSSDRAQMWRRHRRRLIRKLFLERSMQVKPDSSPIAWAGEIIASWSRTGNIGRALRDAEANARHEKRWDDVQLYSAMREQFADWYGQMR